MRRTLILTAIILSGFGSPFDTDPKPLAFNRMLFRLGGTLRSQVDNYFHIAVEDLSMDEVGFRYTWQPKCISMAARTADLNRQSTQYLQNLSVDAKPIFKPQGVPPMETMERDALLDLVILGDPEAKVGARFEWVRDQVLVTSSQDSPFVQRVIPSGFKGTGTFCTILNQAIQSSTAPSQRVAGSNCSYRGGGNLSNYTLEYSTQKKSSIAEMVATLVKKYQIRGVFGVVVRIIEKRDSLEFYSIGVSGRMGRRIRPAR